MLYNLGVEIFAIITAVALFAIIFIWKNRNNNNYDFFHCVKCGESFRWYMGYTGYCPHCGASFNTIIKNNSDQEDRN